MELNESTSKSPEKNKSPTAEIRETELVVPKVIPRYYGRKRSDDSSSETSEDDNIQDVEMKPAFNP